MKRPLYQSLVTRQGLELKNGHAGLWYDKFCNQWCRNSEKSGLDKWTLEAFKPKNQETISPKQDWIDTVTGKRVGDPEQLEHHITRLRKLLEHHHQTPLFYTLESDFVTGLGREHPVENGFAWHHTLGTPYLPGSSVKGLVRAWAEQWADADEASLEHIFGSASKDTKDKRPSRVGSVIFLDALPIQCVDLKADIMTPHYSPYYQDKTGNTPPADWHSPNPIPFLVVEKEQTFVFGVLPRRQDNRDDCKTVQIWLECALGWLGAGAKTAVGYGRFSAVTETISQDSDSPNTDDATSPPPPSPLEEIVQGLRNTRTRELKTRAQGYVDQLRRVDASNEDKRRAAQEMKAILEEANLSRLNKLNAYKDLCQLTEES